jgi:hypothetical protein
MTLMNRWLTAPREAKDPPYRILNGLKRIFKNLSPILHSPGRLFLAHFWHQQAIF